LQPPENLQKLIFPWVEDGFIQISNLIKERVFKSEHSGIGFLKTLQFFRKIILQDAAAFYLDHEHFKKYKMFQLPMFKSKEFLDFKNNVCIGNSSENKIVDGSSVRSLKALMELQQRNGDISQEILNQLKSIREDIRITSGNFLLIPEKHNSFQNILRSAARTIVRSDTHDTQDIVNDLEVQHSLDDIPTESNESSNIHYMAHHSVINSISKVWEEWNHGWDGRPSIKELLEKFGNSWRDMKQKKTFSRRRIIVECINSLVKDGQSFESAIKMVEDERGNMAISSFADKKSKEKTLQ